MAIGIDTICGYLDELELRYAVGRDGDLIIVPFGALNIRIMLCENGEGIALQVPQVYNLSDVPHLEACLSWMCEHTYKHKIGHFGYDPRDGEVDVSFFFPVQDGHVTLEQFRRLLMVCRDVATLDVEDLRRVAHGKPPAVPEDAAGPPDPESAAEIERFQRLLEGLDSEDSGDADDGTTATEAIAEGPRDEAEWLRTVVAAFRTFCGRTQETESLERMRTEMWPEFARAREESRSDERPYRTLRLLEECGIDPREEYVLLFMLARQAAGDALIMTKEVEAVYAAPLEPHDIQAVLSHLTGERWIVSAEQDGTQPYRLGRRYLDALAEVLPFRYEPLPEPFAADEIPTAPVTEQEWLALMRRALAAQATDTSVRDRLTALREAIWPKLLGLRADSVEAGQAYRTAELVRDAMLSSEEELVVCFLAARAACGDDKVDPSTIDLLYSPGIQEPETAALIERLGAAGMVRSTDNDNMPPYTIGPAARAAYLPEMS
jgi:hypothetical protein